MEAGISMSSPTVRARQKAFSDLPDWQLCCEERRQLLTQWGENLEVIVIPGTFFTHPKAHCNFCSAEIPAHKSIHCEPGTTSGFHYTTISVDCFDFDEGPGEGGNREL